MSRQPEPPASTVAAQRDHYREALQRIADAQPPSGDCTCGHVAWACHKRNANIYCGGVTSWAVWAARAALEPLPVVEPRDTEPQA